MIWFSQLPEGNSSCASFERSRLNLIHCLIMLMLIVCKRRTIKFERKFERGEQCMQRHLYEHFNLPGHSGFLNDV